MAKKFFGKLQKAEVIKKAKVHPNLSQFICIDKRYKNYLMLKKLKRIIIDFNQSKFFASVGIKKVKLEGEDADWQQNALYNGTAEGADYEYYDEEDPEQMDAYLNLN